MKMVNYEEESALYVTDIFRGRFVHHTVVVIGFVGLYMNK